MTRRDFSAGALVYALTAILLSCPHTDAATRSFSVAQVQPTAGTVVSGLEVVQTDRTIDQFYRVGSLEERRAGVLDKDFGREASIVFTLVQASDGLYFGVRLRSSSRRTAPMIAIYQSGDNARLAVCDQPGRSGCGAINDIVPGEYGSSDFPLGSDPRDRGLMHGPVLNGANTCVLPVFQVQSELSIAVARTVTPSSTSWVNLASASSEPQSTAFRISACSCQPPKVPSDTDGDGLEDSCVCPSAPDCSSDGRVPTDTDGIALAGQAF